MRSEDLIQLAAAKGPLPEGIDRADAMTQTPVGLSDWLIIMPVILPLLMGVIGIMMRAYPRWTSRLTVAVLAGVVLASAALLSRVIAEGPIAMTMGQWLPPFGISLVVDPLGGLLTLLGSITGLIVAVYALSDVDFAARRAGFYSMLCWLIAGVNGAFLTGDIFNLYVWFEVFVIASFGLIVLGGERLQLDGAVKYCVLNLIATTLFLIAVALLYGTLGTLNMADLSGKLAAYPPDDPQMLTIGLLFFVGFGMKAAAVPLHIWLPASYHTPKPVVSALFAALLTKVGIYAVLRTYTIVMPASNESVLFEVIYVVAIATIVLGLLGALAESNLRRMLGFLLISGVGVMLLGLGVDTRLSLAATIFYTVHSVIVMAGLYLLAGLMERRTGLTSLHRLSGMYTGAPVLAVLFFVLGFAAAGLPPLSGFWPKVLLIEASLNEQQYVAVAALIVNGLFSMMVVGRAWALMFWRPVVTAGIIPQAETPHPREQAAPVPKAAALSAAPTPPKAEPTPGHNPPALLVPVVVTAAAALIIGVWPTPLLDLSDIAAGDLLDPSAYVQAVFGSAP
ncbi:Na+/H+ antiporter subunit D [Dichotomicrobium thermohalophilum]|uniref:Multicomponent Na+:H+ antiporter subunit D n=1 Tax=Dichotomicrobium thermohalophilum TaxID=933063 RepID=A0A397Q3S7_9HYPH|nr:Na+/H+ antiporter subunit D [Dichotomicrobium thermohalophilum]RIA56180.1 multicomponent Na+:H+ antiporter subunit D [Dichotomicrobium thermohalophilum]